MEQLAAVWRALVKQVAVKAGGRAPRTVRLRGWEACERRDLLSAAPVVTAVEVSGTNWGTEFVSYLQSHGLGDQGYAIPTGSSLQTAALPWANVNQIRIQFSDDVRIDASDMVLSGAANTQYEFSDFTYDYQTYEAVWTLTANLSDDKLLIDLNADGLDPIRSLSHVALDGEWTDNVTSGPSGDGTAGGDFEFTLHVVPGDYDGSGSVNFVDYMQVYQRLFTGTSSPNYEISADITANGAIDGSDFNLVYANYADTLPSGSPAGASNDGPSAAVIPTQEIFDDTSDVTVPLGPYFDDLEDSDSQMVFQVQANSAPALFDSVSINSSTGALVINTAANQVGQAEITLSVTDTGGFMTLRSFLVNVDRSNTAPQITMSAEEMAPNTWRFFGTATDVNETAVGWLVELTGLFNARVVVEPGSPLPEFEYIQDNVTHLDYVYASVYDSDGTQSNVVAFDLSEY